MSQAAAFIACQMPERSGLPSVVRRTAPDGDSDCGGGTPAPKGANEQRPNTAPASHEDQMFFRTFDLLLFVGTIDRGASSRGTQEKVASIGKRDFSPVGNRPAVPREKTFHDDLASWHEVGLSQAPSHERVRRTGL